MKYQLLSWGSNYCTIYEITNDLKFERRIWSSENNIEIDKSWYPYTPITIINPKWLTKEEVFAYIL